MDIQVVRDGSSAILPDLGSMCLVYLFGSRVERTVGSMSDYDFAVLLERGVDGQ